MGRTIEIEEIRDKFWSKIEKSINGCWNFKGNETKGGYMIFYGEKEHILAHRFSYKLFKGKIPEGLQIDHLCKNTRCVNPDHLEVVTPRENNLRSNNFSGINARKTHCPKGHEYTKENTIIHKNGFNGARRCRICLLAKAFEYRRENGANIRVFKQKSYR